MAYTITLVKGEMDKILPFQDGSATVQIGEKPHKSSLSPEGALHKVPKLDKRFKKPPPHKNRRKPSKGHLKQMATNAGQSHMASISV